MIGGTSSHTTDVVGDIIIGDKSGDSKYLLCDGSHTNSSGLMDKLIPVEYSYGAWTADSLSWNIGKNIAYGNGYYVATALNAEAVYFSTNGTAWTQYNIAGSGEFYFLIFVNGTFVLGAKNYIYKSTNGSSWVSYTNSIGEFGTNGIAYGNGYLIATIPSSTSIAISTDTGSTWSVSTTTLSGEIKSISFGYYHFVAIDSSAQSAYSSTGASWTITATLASTTTSNIMYGNGLFIAGRASGRIIRSVDGKNWTSSTSGLTESVSTVAYGNGLFIAGSCNLDSPSDGEIAISIDGMYWEKQSISINNYGIRSIAYGNKVFLCVYGYNASGMHNYLMTSTVTPTKVKLPAYNLTAYIRQS